VTEISRLIVVGYGNMGGVIGRAVAAARAAASEAGGPVRVAPVAGVVAVDPIAPAEQDVVSGGGIGLVRSLGEAGPVLPSDVVVLAVKPQVFPQVAGLLRAALPAGSALVISVMAGVTIDRLRAELGPRARIVRAMPNTPAKVGQGATAFAIPPDAADPEGDAAVAGALLGCLGPLVVRVEESLMDAFTAVAGSGPAYLFYLAEGMIDGAVAAGFDPADAGAVVRQTLLGAATLLARDPAPPAELRQRVTSKAGTTEAAMEVLTRRGAAAAVRDAVIAARDRGRQLGA